MTTAVPAGPRAGVAALVAGAFMALAFAPTGLWWAAPTSIAAFTVLLSDRSGRGGFGLGFAYGLGLFLALLRWLTVIGTDAWIGVALYSALWMGGMGAGIAMVMRLRMWPVLVPCVWILAEALRGRIPLGGWTWGRVAFSQDGAPWLGWAALGGAPALTFAVALMGSLAGWLLLRNRGRAAAPRGWAIAAAVLLLVVPVAGALVPRPATAEALRGPAEVVVGVVQGNVPQSGLDFNAQRRAVLDNHVRGTFDLAEEAAAGRQPAPEVVLWPENASDIDPSRNADARAAIDSAARAVGVPILVGAVVDHPDDPDLVLNQGIVWDPVAGPGETYTKRNLVPFGEYIPARSVLAPRIERFDQIPRDFAAGTEPGDLRIGPTVIGDSLCFDVAYDRNLRQAVAAGARMLVVQTNNATYNGTDQTWQQLAMSRVRAVEHGRAMVVVSTSGVTAVIDPTGQIVPGTLIGELQPAAYALPVVQRDTVTVADRVGAVPEAAAGLVALVAIGTAWRESRRARAGTLG